MTWNEWGIVASIIGAAIGTSALLQAWLLGRATKAFHADVHTATQATLKDLQKGFSESHERLGQILERMDARHTQTLQRMDQAAEQRAEALRALIERR